MKIIYESTTIEQIFNLLNALTITGLQNNQIISNVSTLLQQNQIDSNDDVGDEVENIVNDEK